MAKKSPSKKGPSTSSGSKSPAAKKSSAKVESSSTGLQLAPLIFLGLSALSFLITRIRLLAIPLERDEGSFAYIGHWLFKGKQLYTDMLDSKLPGLYTYYAFFTSLFGYNATGVHMGLLVANVVTAICFYLLLKEL